MVKLKLDGWLLCQGEDENKVFASAYLSNLEKCIFDRWIVVNQLWIFPSINLYNLTFSPSMFSPSDSLTHTLSPSDGDLNPRTFQPCELYYSATIKKATPSCGAKTSSKTSLLWLGMAQAINIIALLHRLVGVLARTECLKLLLSLGLNI